MKFSMTSLDRFKYDPCPPPPHQDEYRQKFTNLTKFRSKRENFGLVPSTSGRTNRAERGQERARQTFQFLLFVKFPSSSSPCFFRLDTRGGFCQVRNLEVKESYLIFPWPDTLSTSVLSEVKADMIFSAKMVLSQQKFCRILHDQF